MIKAAMSFYEKVTTTIQDGFSYSDEFPVKVGVDQESESFSLFCVLPVNCREVYILKFILTFRLAMDARLHQKTELRAENQS